MKLNRAQYNRNCSAQRQVATRIPAAWLGISIGLIFFTQISLAMEVNVSDSLPDFKGLAGNGKLTQTIPIEGTSTLEASLELVSNLSIDGEKSCNGLTLKTSKESIVTMLACESGKLFMCTGAIEDCVREETSPTQIKNGVWESRGSIHELKYTVEFLADRLVYRIHEKNCLIPYPHGCLIYGFG